MLLLLVLALIGYETSSGEGVGEEVLIGQLPSQELGDAAQQELSLDEHKVESSAAALEELQEIEVQPLVAATADQALTELPELTPLSGGAGGGSFELGTAGIGGSMGGGNWNGMLQGLRRHGLDVVITFDSTDSMGGEIQQVKRQIQRIGSTLLRLVPNARIGLCTYRDADSSFVARGLPLTGDVTELERFLEGVDANEGGDWPEAVHEGLRWAVENNQFRARARKVILLFGDAQPHAEHRQTCLRIAAEFHGGQGGIVSTVTCRRTILDEFDEIARAGGGEAFLTSDERQIMQQLMVLVFGSEYRSKVLEAFELMEN
jgi:hypothetical protein